MLATEWKSLAGVGGKRIEIEPYKSSGYALAYVLKLADRDDCHWDFSNNLSLFLPENGDLSNAQNRRRYRRHLARANSPPDRVTVDSCFDIQKGFNGSFRPA
jgi:hypothetical protein